jgi:hypothetical protein
VIEDHQTVMADWIIDHGAGRGPRRAGGSYERTPADLLPARSTLTGEHWRRSSAAFRRLSL